MSASDYLDIEVTRILQETELAFLVILEDNQNYWIPKSQVLDLEEYEVGDKDVSMSISEWFCDKEGISG